MFWSLFGFGMGMIAAHLQRWIIQLVLREVLLMFVSYLMVSGPKWLRCLMLMPSGPVQLLFVLFEMANCTCVVVSHISSLGRFLIVWFIWSDICELFVKSCFFVYVSDSCFSSKIVFLVVLDVWFTLTKHSLQFVRWHPTCNLECDTICV